MHQENRLTENVRKIKKTPNMKENKQKYLFFKSFKIMKIGSDHTVTGNI